MKKTSKNLSLILALILLLSSFPISANAALSDMTWTQYKTKYQSFINDSRWNPSGTWGYNQRPKLSSWQSQGCCAYAADFAKYVFDAPSQKAGEVFYEPSEIRSGDIIYIYNSDNDQHWFIVLERSGNTLYTAEGNYAGKICVLSTRYAVNGNTLKNGKKTFKGYHYLKAEVAQSPSAVLGSEFYATVLKTDSWTNIYNNCGSCELKKSPSDSKSLWRFVQNEDESYSITNAYDASCLTFSQSDSGEYYLSSAQADGSEAQKWLVENNGFDYRLSPKSLPSFSVCALENNGSDSVKLSISPKVSDESQRFSVCVVPESDIVLKSALSVTPGRDGPETVFVTVASDRAAGYRLKIYSGGNLYKSVDFVGGLSVRLLLPDGKYTAYTEAFNSFKSVSGDSVSFTVGCEHTHTTITVKAKEPTCTQPGNTRGVKCSDCSKVLEAPQTIEKKGHSYKSKVTKATVSKDGKIVLICKECQKKKTKEIIYHPENIVLSKESFTYSGKVKSPKVTVTDSSGNIIDSSNYTVEYENNKKVGTARVILKFKGKYYSGTLTKNFKILPRGTQITAVKAKSKSLSLKWDKKTEQISGYEVRCSTSKGFSKKATTTLFISDRRITEKTISDLKGSKRYYVKIRTYKISDGVKYYSAWSDVRSVKTKK